MEWHVRLYKKKFLILKDFLTNGIWDNNESPQVSILRMGSALRASSCQRVQYFAPGQASPAEK
jgi:hypothetical protein